MDSARKETDTYLGDLERPTDQLIDEVFGSGAAPVQVHFGARSDRGKVRPSNEDHFVIMRRSRSQEVLLSNFTGATEGVEEHAYAFAVADGMGGEVFGKMASMLAIQTGLNLGQFEIDWQVKVDERETHAVLEKLRLYMKLMDRALIQRGEEQPEARGMGTTFTLAYTSGHQVFIGHVGDSRAYLLRDGKLEQRTRDHTLAQEMLDAGSIEPDSSAYRRAKHMLTNCLGGPAEGVVVNTHYLRVVDGDRVLLCSDGLTDMVDDSAIRDILTQESDSQAAADALVERALENGGRDNVTAVVATYSVNNADTPETPSVLPQRP